MILTCPSCSARYNVPNEDIGIDGRTVRCRKCQHEWFQSGERKKLEDLISMVQESDLDLDQLSFDDGKKRPKQKDKGAGISLVARISGVSGKIRLVLSPVLQNQGAIRHFAAGMVAIAVFSCFILVLVTARWGITGVFPSLMPIYESAGFPLVGYARLNPEDALIIDRVDLKTHESKPDQNGIIGHLINLTSRAVRVPQFKISYVNDRGGVLHDSIEILPIHVIGKEGVFPFHLPLLPNLSEDVTSLKITFVEDGHHEKK